MNNDNLNQGQRAEYIEALEFERDLLEDCKKDLDARFFAHQIYVLDYVRERLSCCDRLKEIKREIIQAGQMTVN